MVRTCLLAALAAIVGCAADGDGGGGGPGGRDGGIRDSGSALDAPGFDAGPRTDGGLVECDGISAEADNVLAPVDVIWIVDSSDSMENDARAVQENLDGFVDFIASSGIDYHVVFVSDRGFVSPSPLFASDPSRFLFVDRHVGSQDVFARALDQFSAYSHFLRPTAITHIIGVTDDEDDMGAATFISMMEALLGHEFTFHAIAAEEGSFGLACTRGGGIGIPAADVGDRYFDAADMTGGLKFNICDEDWSGLFTTLAETVAVSEELPCVYDLPEPPAGMTFDRDRVNVEHTPEGATDPTVFPRAPGEPSCGTEQAWYYDDESAPTQIILCPAACDAVTSGPGRVDVRLGCETILI